MNWFSLLLFLVFGACVACLYAEGLWSNAIRLINVVTAALLATDFWEPAAGFLDDKWHSFAYFWDFLALWGLFALLMVVFRVATDFLSRVKVRFLSLADRIGSALLAMWIGWVMVCFTATTLHTAPLAREFLFGSFQAESRASSRWSPEVMWLGFVQQASSGSFCRSATPEERKQDKYVFDPRGEFMPRYATRRAMLESHVQATGSLRE
jgi:uncharacterized membrane protein required for colicin V production